MTRSAIRTAIGIAALAVALGGCDQLREITGMSENGAAPAANSADSGNVALAGAGDKPMVPVTPADPALASQIAAAATELNQRTPMTVDAITSLTGVRAQGTEIIYDMAVSQDLPSAQIETIRQTAQAANQTNLCRDPNASRLIRMGASMNHHYTDPTGDRFETRVATCPG